MFDQQDYLKVTNAAYKLIEYFPDGDPLKNTTKQKVLTILEGATSAISEAHFLQVAKDIEILKNYLSLARYQGWMSDMNFIIIAREYDQLAFSVARKMPKHEPSVTAVSKPGDIHPEKEIAKQAVESLVAQLPKKTEMVNQETPEKKPEAIKKALPKTEPENQNLNKATARQKKILDIVKRVPKTQVADIIKHLPNVTKRTIRRDLDLLLKEGRVQRMGEWNQVFYEIA